MAAGTPLTFSDMCNALSPEKAVIWSVLQGESASGLKSDYFRHTVYRWWFDAANRLRERGQTVDLENLERELHSMGVQQSHADSRALKRLLKVSVPARIRDNTPDLVGALADIHYGNRVHLEHLIN